MARFRTRLGKWIPVIGSIVDLAIFARDAIRERRRNKETDKLIKESKERIERILDRAKGARK